LQVLVCEDPFDFEDGLHQAPFKDIFGSSREIDQLREIHGRTTMKISLLFQVGEQNPRVQKQQFPMYMTPQVLLLNNDINKNL
jgi:hypothetical protein